MFYPLTREICLLLLLQAKKAIKEVPKDDEEVDRQEEGEIDRGFTESSSSSEDELTEAGTYIHSERIIFLPSGKKRMVVIEFWMGRKF